jgi:hypothetical protein
MKNRKKYIFITSEGFTYQPKNETAEPDIENMQVLGFGEGITVKKALDNMLAENDYLLKTNFCEAIAIELRGTKQERLLLRR